MLYIYIYICSQKGIYNEIEPDLRFLITLYTLCAFKRSDSKSNVKLGGFRSRLQVFYVFSHTKEL